MRSKDARKSLEGGNTVANIGINTGSNLAALPT
jgi:hypothetical protein